MEKLLHKRKCLMENEINRWVFLGMKFSENINGWTLHRPSIALTFSSNICIIPGRLLPGRACFRLYRRSKDKTINSISEMNNVKKFAQQILKNYFCKLKTGLKNVCKFISVFKY